MKAKFSWVLILLAALMLSVIIFNSEGRVTGITGVDFQDRDIYRAILTNLRQLAMFAVVFILAGLSIYYSFLKDLSRKNERLSDLYRAKMDFLQDMSHEMKNSLNVLAAGVDYTGRQMAGEESDAQTAQSAIEYMREETLRLGRMVDSMVSLSDMSETGGDRQRLDFAALLESGAWSLMPELEKRGNTLRTHIAPGLPDVFVEKDRFAQVLINLIANAAEHTRDGLISVTAEYDQDYIAVRVADTGDGLPEDILPHALERGVSGKGSTGYGLHICKTIVEAHGGTIAIENGREKGAVATFTIPVCCGQDAGCKL